VGFTDFTGFEQEVSVETIFDFEVTSEEMQELWGEDWRPEDYLREIPEINRKRDIIDLMIYRKDYDRAEALIEELTPEDRMSWYPDWERPV